MINNLVYLVRCCQMAYEEDMSVVAQVLKPASAVELWASADGDYSALFCVPEDSTVAGIFAFRGTTTLHDWFTDFDVQLVNGAGFDGRIHAGFYQAFCEALPWVNSIIVKYKLSQALVTGHSMGGALAVLTSFICKFPATTFGCPRVGDNVFSTAYDKRAKHTRIVNGYDPVPTVPLTIPDYDYTHTGIEIKIGQHCRIWDIIKHLWQGPVPLMLDAIDDHHINSYVTAVINDQKG